MFYQLWLNNYFKDEVKTFKNPQNEVNGIIKNI